MSELGTRRHHARERALEIMYEASIKDRPVLVVVEESHAAPDDYVISLLTSSELNVERANKLISQSPLIGRSTASHWWTDWS